MAVFLSTETSLYVFYLEFSSHSSTCALCLSFAIMRFELGAEYRSIAGEVRSILKRLGSLEQKQRVGEPLRQMLHLDILVLVFSPPHIP